MERPKKGEFYKHFKGDTYQIIGYARDEATLKELVLYLCFKDNIIWARSLEEFVGIHPDHGVKRFERMRV